MSHFLLLLAISISVCADYAVASNPSFNDVSDTISTVRVWITDGLRVSEEYANQLPSETSVCIVLRHHGQVLGTGIADGESPQPLLEAARSAFREIKTHKSYSKLSPDIKELALGSISIELELGGKPLASPSNNFTRFAKKVNVGMDGIGVRRGSKWDIRLPAIMRLSPKTTIETVLVSLCMNVGVHPANAISHQLNNEEDITLYTIPTTTGVQDKIGGVIRELIRGDEIVTRNNVSLFELADMLANHLITCTGESGSVVGVYQPETDSLSSPFATPFVQVMVASALKEYSELHACSSKKLAKNTASLIFNDVEKKYYENTHIPIEVAASVVIALTSDQSFLNDGTQQFYRACVDSIKQFASNATKVEEIEKPHIFALVVLATSTLAVESDDLELRATAENLCNMCLTRVPLQARVSTIPWIAEAVLLLSDNGSKVDKTPLDELFTIVLSSQIIEDSNSDVHGGFLLSSPSGAVADARGLRMLPMLATMSSPNKSDALRALMLSTRFLAQLTTRKERASRFQNPAMAIGGVRASAWDASMPTEATAMALIGATRAIKSLNLNITSP